MKSITLKRVGLTFPKLAMSIPPFKVLLLDDHPEEAFILTRTLNQVGKVFWEQNINKGIDLAHQETFDIALVDLNLVSKYSLEAFEELHNQCPELPIIILSDSDTVLFAESALNAGALGVINKRYIHEVDYVVKLVTKQLLKARFIKKAAKLYMGKKPILNLIKD